MCIRDSHYIGSATFTRVRYSVVKLTSSAQFLAERPMYFDYAGKWDGGHCLLGTSAHPTWYFAEGYTGPGFDEWLCLWTPERRLSMSRSLIAPRKPAPSR